MALGALLGCLGTIAVATLVCAGGVGGMAAMVMSAGPVPDALEMVNEDQRVVARLGAPITSGMFSGEITEDNGKGYADLIVPLYGIKGSASLSIEAGSRRDSWTFSDATVTFEDGSTLDLLDDADWDDEDDTDE